MAITINSTPENYASMHDALYFVASSNNTSQSDFKYVFDVRINNTLISRLKVFPDVSGKGIFNASQIVRSFWSSYFKPNATQTAFAYTGNDYSIEYVIQFGEEYAGTTYTNLANGTYRAYNFGQVAFRDYSSSYLSGYVNKLLTNRDKLQLTHNGTEKLYASYFKDASGTLALTVNNGVTSQTGSSVTVQTFTLFDLSPAAINTYLGSNFVTSFQDYSVTIGSQQVSVKRVCTKYESVAIHFLNELGGYDSFHFRLVNRETRDMERKKFEVKLWELSGNNMTRYDSYKRMSGGVRPYIVNQALKYRLTSDYINETDWEWLRELMTSTEVYMEVGGYYYPVMITDSNWQQKYRITDKLINVNITVEVMSVNSQYR